MQWARWKRGFVIGIQGAQYNGAQYNSKESQESVFKFGSVMALLQDEPKSSQHLFNARGKTSKAQSPRPRPVVHPLGVDSRTDVCVLLTDFGVLFWMESEDREFNLNRL